MTGRALPLAKEDLLAVQLGRAGLGGIELDEDVELGRGREVQQLLEFGHEMDLAAALQDVDAFLGGDDHVAVKISAALLEFGEVLDRLQGPLRAEQALDIDTAQRRRVDATAMFLRAHVAR